MLNILSTLEDIITLGFAAILVLSPFVFIATYIN